MNERELEKLLAGMRGEENSAQQLRGELERLSGDLGGLTAELGKLGTASQAQAKAAAENTRAVSQSAAPQASEGGSSAAAGVGKAIWKWVGSGLTLSPLWKGLAGLFGGEEAEAAAAPVVWMPPPAVRLEGEVSRAGGQEQYAWEWEQLWRRGTAPREGSQITVQVQALDSRSFLDHSEEIARAVREAMLNAHGLNDVVGEV